MECSLKIELSIKKVTDGHARKTLYALAGTLASTVIIFGALGAIQNQCRGEDPELLIGVNGFSGAVMTCKKVYRYYWFITALCFVTALYGLWNTARGFLKSTRGAILGLLVIANLLTINMTDAFLTMQSISKWQGGVGRDRDRTMIAGCIITAVFQSLSIIFVGMDPAAVSEEKTYTSAKEVIAEPIPAVELATAPAAPVAETASPAPHVPPPAADVEAPAPIPAEVPAAEAVPAPVAEPSVEVAVDPVEEKQKQ